MTANQLREKFIKFFKEKGHKVIPSASLVPENDPTALFVSAGMQPLVPYLMGEAHPEGKKIVGIQKCIRTDDIDEVGDKVHHTFFEMLGNWSLGDYFKKEAIELSYEFLTGKEWLSIDKSRLAVSVFAGDDDAPFDNESYDKWKLLGIPVERIAKLPKKNNWWGPVGESGPCGPDTEMFIWTGNDEAPISFQDTFNDPNWVEVWNDVFMEYNLTAKGYESLAQKNVDTGMGLERMLAVINKTDSSYQTDLFIPIIEKIEELSGQKYDFDSESMTTKSFRVIADHLKAAVFAISDDILPSNKGAGYVTRRLIRRAVVKANQLGIKSNLTSQIADVVFKIYNKEDVRDRVKNELKKEESRFRTTLSEGLKIIDSKKEVSGKSLFNLYQSFGIPIEISLEEFRTRGRKIDDSMIQEFNRQLKAHQALSRTASAGMFRGGLTDASETATKYHTTTHLLHQALRQVLGDHVQQKGSNITADRLRFDFSHPEKMTRDQISEVENIVNGWIKQNLNVKVAEMTLREAKMIGALGFFDHKYGHRVKVYSIESSEEGKNISCELCGGPHVSSLSILGHFKIKKEESSSAGVRRIKAVLE